jgi:hypothetical protein
MGLLGESVGIGEVEWEGIKRIMNKAESVGNFFRHQTGLGFDGIGKSFLGNVPSQNGIEQAIYKVHG